MLPLRYAGIGARRRKDMAKKALEQVGLGDRMNHSPTNFPAAAPARGYCRSIVNERL